MLRLFLTLLLSLNLFGFERGVIVDYIESEYLKSYQTMQINSIELDIPREESLAEFEVESMDLNSNRLRRDSGSFNVVFKRADEIERVYIRYKIDADILILKANRDIKRDELITKSDFSEELIKFDSLYHKPLTEIEDLIARTYIREGRVLTEGVVERAPAIYRGQRVKAIMKDGYISIKFEAISLEDGLIGESIRVKNLSGVNFNAKVISNSKVEIE